MVKEPMEKACSPQEMPGPEDEVRAPVMHFSLLRFHDSPLPLPQEVEQLKPEKSNPS